jgi:hypothetical protein
MLRDRQVVTLQLGNPDHRIVSNGLLAEMRPASDAGPLPTSGPSA